MLPPIANDRIQGCLTYEDCQFANYPFLDLQWEQPRATAISYASIIGFIFAARYLPLLRWVFKFLYMSLGCKLVA